MKPDYKNMTKQKLKEHLLTHRDDDDAWEVFFDKLGYLDPNEGYSPDLSLEEMEKIFKAKLNRNL